MNTIEKDCRKHERVETFNHALIGYQGVFIPGIALNLCPTGMLIDIQKPLKALPLELQVYLTCGRNKTLSLPAQVVHMSGSRVGLYLTSEETVDLNICAFAEEGV